MLPPTPTSLLAWVRAGLPWVALSVVTTGVWLDAALQERAAVQRLVITFGLIGAAQAGLLLWMASLIRQKRSAADVIHRQVTDLQQVNGALQEHNRHTQAISEAVLAILRHDNGRAAIVRAAQKVSAAASVTLFEADGHGDLVCTSATQDDLVGMRTPAASHGAVARCFGSGKHVWVEDGTSPGADLDGQMLASAQQSSRTSLQGGAAFPIISAGRCLGVLGMAWPPNTPAPGDRVAILQLLADQTALALAHQDLMLELQRLSNSDPLTGAANRRAWEIALSHEMPRALREHRPLSVLMIDLDHFKAYNDTHGHDGGDQLLREVAARWMQRLRPGDLLCRWGGEEFAVLLLNSTAEGAVSVAEDLHALMPTGITCSIGVAEWDRRQSHLDVVREADMHLYAAKDAGRNRTQAAGLTRPL